MLKFIVDFNVFVELWEMKGCWKMEMNLIDDLKVSLGIEDVVIFIDGVGI